MQPRGLVLLTALTVSNVTELAVVLPQIPICVPRRDECHYEQEYSLFVWRSKSAPILMALPTAQGSDAQATMCKRFLVLQRLYVTMFPCNECAKLLIQAGITEVVFYEVTIPVLLPVANMILTAKF